MFFRKSFLLRATALFLAFNLLTQVFFPLAAYALTSGPTVPETTSFEPVDTTDMVNLASGDFTYNIPLLEVPGPEGGYPLSLSYNAGIRPDVEASWLGLGWNLNPGAINRTLNGYADDHDNAKRSVTDYWAGGTSKALIAGFTYGPQLGALGTSVSGTIVVSQDTYKGFSVNAIGSVGASAGPLSVGISSVSGLSASAGVSFYGVASASYTISSTDFQSIKSNTNLSAAGISLSSKEKKISLSKRLTGFQIEQVNNNQGRISSEGWSFDAPYIPIPTVPGLLFNLRYEYKRYWSYEMSDVGTFGSLYNYKGYNPDIQSLDSYTLLDPELGVVDDTDGDRVLGGGFAAADDYVVLAQGLGGSIRPYAFDNPTLFRQNTKKDNKYIVQFKKNYATSRADFRFINDFSNSLTYDSNADVEFNRYSTTPMRFTATTPIGESSGRTGNRLAGTKHIEWYTNEEISQGINGRAFRNGFINYEEFSKRGASRYGYNVANQVGGFSITNERGVTYHYALPVYNYRAFSYTDNTPVRNEKGYAYRRALESHPYAYTWLLTAVTGPDFVDRNNNGLADNDDYGYWVTLDYGLWADNYQWRNPAEGKHKGLDRSAETYSAGFKEVYYLNSVSTRSHTAIFEKEIRADGKGLSPSGGFYPSVESHLEPAQCEGQFGYEPCSEHWESVNYPTASLKLNNIYLLKNEDITWNLKSLSTAYNHTFNFKNHIGQDGATVHVHKGENIIDNFDIQATYGQVREKSIKVISFSHDYTLSPETINSYDEAGQIYSVSPDLSSNPTKKGKLTLKEVKFLGKSGYELLPGTKFKYDLESQPVLSSVVKSSSQTAYYIKENSLGTLNLGDIIKFNHSNKDYYALLSGPEPGVAGAFSLRFVGENYPDFNSTYSINVVQTKNPPYKVGYYDMWGMYKPDYQDLGNENLSRLTTNISSKSADVWSLRKIESPLGAVININYESDDYRTPGLYKSSLLNIKSATPQTSVNAVRLEFHESGADLRSFLTTGSKMDMLGLFRFFFRSANTFPNGDGQWTNAGNTYEVHKISENENQIVEVGNNFVVLSSKKLFDKLKEDKPDSTLQTFDYSGRTINTSINFDPNAYWVGGNLAFKDPMHTEGGGIRVSSIAVTSPSTEATMKTQYFYEGGTTSFEPLGLEKFFLDFANFKNTYKYEKERIAEVEKGYKRKSFKSLSELMAVVREIPAPGVIYESVRVRNTIEHKKPKQEFTLAGDQEFFFEVFDERSAVIPVLGETVSGSHTFYRTASGGTPENPCDPQMECEPDEGSTNDVVDKTVSTRKRKITYSDYSSRIGGLKRVLTYDKSGSLLTEVMNHYLHDDKSLSDFNEALRTRYRNQGVVSELYNEYRIIDDKVHYAVLSERREYPSIQIGKTEINHKTGLRSTTEHLAFDFYSGQVVKALSSDSYGNYQLVETLPAYHVYPQMGLKIQNAQNKNMLTQEAASTVYSVTQAYKNDQSNPAYIQGVISGSVQTWANNVEVLSLGKTNADQNKIWRKQASYSWMPSVMNTDGLTPLTGYNPYNFASTSSQASWTKTGEITLYNAYSHALEASDINGNYVATKMDGRQEKVLVSGGPAHYAEIAYSGAEDALIGSVFGGGVAKGTGTVSDEEAHTGVNSVLTNYLETAFTFSGTRSSNKLSNSLQASKAYTISAWAKGDLAAAKLYYSVNGGAKITTGTSVMGNNGNGWYLLTLNVPAASSGTLEVGCVNEGSGSRVYFDDFRFQPLSSSIASYVYDSHSEQVTHILDANNLYTRYDYDAMGRLRSTHRESLENGVKKISESEYHYALQKSPSLGGLAASTLTAVSLAASSPGSKSVSVQVNGLPNAYAPYKITLDPGSRGTPTNISIGYTATSITEGTFSYTINPYQLILGKINDSTTPNQPVGSFTLTYQSGGTYWVKLKVTDAQGNYRELVQKVVVPN